MMVHVPHLPIGREKLRAVPLLANRWKVATSLALNFNHFTILPMFLMMKKIKNPGDL
jgi:hypothetical protein